MKGKNGVLGNQCSQAATQRGDQLCKSHHIGLANHEASTDGIGLVARLRDVLVVDETLAMCNMTWL